jgi:DNA/RNA endonuclease YhcR with UshA esterase domain
MKKLFILCLFLITNHSVWSQLISIADARLQPVGSTVTVSGIVTSGSEFGTIRYMQDGTGGIAVFSSSLSTTVRGDVVTVTGVTSQFQNLLEITPVNSWSLQASGNPLPTPVVLTPNQVVENYESMLVQINNVNFSTTGVFQGNASYNFTSNGETGVVYIRSSNPLVGTAIPTSNITLYGLVSQFATQYQILPRDINDLVTSSGIAITTTPHPLNITNNGFFVAWNTNIPGDAFIRYGNTPNLELGSIAGGTGTTSPVIAISGTDASELFYVQAFSVDGNDTAFSAVKSYITASNSTGIIKTYFNRPVDVKCCKSVF